MARGFRTHREMGPMGPTDPCCGLTVPPMVQVVFSHASANRDYFLVEEVWYMHTRDTHAASVAYPRRNRKKLLCTVLRVACLPVYFGSLKFIPLLGSTIQQLAPTRATAR